ncbi:MAG: hypothetical protein JWN37_514 [Candidatus Nomurabacteria bacterium]|nr:hypothetical protein [Candidatus Nomurabacteria bacterium]
MELRKIRGGNLEELQQKQYTIGIGVSLGNKWFTVENIVALTRWSLEHTKDVVVVYVADYIHAINLEVRNGITHAKALELSNKMGNVIIEKVKNEIDKSFSLEEKEKIIYASWKDLMDDRYKEDVKFLYNYYESNPLFKDTLKGIIKGFTKNENRTFDDQQINRMAHYVIEEMPEMLKRVKIKNVLYDANAYPYDGELTIFFENIQLGKIFPEIKDRIITTKPKVFLEVR